MIALSIMICILVVFCYACCVVAGDPEPVYHPDEKAHSGLLEEE